MFVKFKKIGTSENSWLLLFPIVSFMCDFPLILDNETGEYSSTSSPARLAWRRRQRVAASLHLEEETSNISQHSDRASTGPGLSTHL